MAIKGITDIEHFPINEKSIEMKERSNVITGDKNYLYYRLKESFKNANKIDIIVSFLMESGVKIILNDLKEALDRGVKIRILTGNYLNITQPSALCLLKDVLKDKIDLRFYNEKHRSFHPKAYMFHNDLDSEIYIGSSNISKGALTSSIEWNYRFVKSEHCKDYEDFSNTFEDLFKNHAIIVDDEVLENYSKNWSRPNVYKDFEKVKEKEKISDMVEPKEAQIEALYSLKKSREEGFDKGLVIAATGIGKTYLAAFDSKNYNRVLFVAHREEIIKQAKESFMRVRKSDDMGFFYGDDKSMNNSVVFALVQSLGKKEYLNSEYFDKEYFDYIIIDEFHHAVSNNYKNIIDYFTPKFMLGLTATPERLDSKDVFALCDYNMVYEVRLKDAINKGWLVPFRYYGIYDDTVDYSMIEFKNGKYNDKSLEESLMINRRSELILKNYLKYNSKSAMGFCSSKSHAQYMADYFTQEKVPALAVYSGCKVDREDALSKLRIGEIKVIFSVDMFNEGLDVPSIDMVMFLRPTQSPTVFLQQLGRGLRKHGDKKYLNVLDFIGNYKKAELIPFLLSGKDRKDLKSGTKNPMTYNYPEDCFVDFDFRVIDIFKTMAEKEMSISQKVKEEFYRIKEEIQHTPSRIEFFLNMDSAIYDNIRTKSKINPFNKYLEFLYENDELIESEINLYNTRSKEFINMIETTSMRKSYKMPIFLAFYNNGNVKMKIDKDDIYDSFKAFYEKGSNKVDMLKDQNTLDFESWDKKRYIKLAKDNPIKALLKTHNDFFKKDDEAELAFYNEMNEFIKDENFKKHFKDAIDLRVLRYYEDRHNKK
ncbi:DEAD/DEAH box helicase family protein [Clostridium senegalense]|uniref:DEAD/DEAH box helicase family protein n=1 Tax=Clostridium senegalense TaxID=1465809 RepID=A0A6M0H7G6_9CLOT|nr:DEAD/DEAH box helicase family protein [Clostridium senegalense]